jgi:hypothetical protein
VLLGHPVTHLRKSKRALDECDDALTPDWVRHSDNFSSRD